MTATIAFPPELSDADTLLWRIEADAVLLQEADPQLWLTALRVTIDVPSDLFLG